MKTDANFDEALSRATTYHLLAHAFGRPDSQFQAYVRKGGFLRDLRMALSRLRWRIGLRTAIANLQNAIASDRTSLEEEHTRLFNPSLAVQCPPYETEYGATHVFMKAQRLADIAGFYRAFGLAPARQAHERPDNVAAELEFMYVLALKEARALATGQEDKAAICRDAQAKFLGEHLGCWLASYAERLHAEADDIFYAALAALAEAFVAADAQRLGATPISTLKYRPPLPEPAIRCPAARGESHGTP